MLPKPKQPGDRLLHLLRNPCETRRRAALLERFGDIGRLRAASRDEIAAVDGFGPRLAAELHAFLNPPAASA